MEPVSNQKLFREAMAHLSAAVNIITTDGPHGQCGLTASAVCSVTDTPPTMLVCINQSSASHDVLAGNARLCINVLPADHQELAGHFAGFTKLSMAMRFAQHSWTTGELGLPLLNDALASLEGNIIESKTMGSHSVMFVEISHIHLRTDGDGLTYFGRQFHRLPRATTPG